MNEKLEKCMRCGAEVGLHVSKDLGVAICDKCIDGPKISDIKEMSIDA